MAYTGRVGSGKTYTMVSDAVKYIGKRPIFSNDPSMGAWATIFEDWEQLIGLSSCLVLLDEAGIWFNSRDFGRFPKEVANWFMQSRKSGCDLWWTAQSAMSVDTHIRRLTATQWECCRYGPAILAQGIDPGSHEKFGRRVLWLNQKVWSYYDTFSIVGDSSGTAAKRGAASVAAESRELQELLRGALVVEDDGGAIRLRPAQPSDFADGKRIVRRGADGRLAEVDTARFAMRVS